MGNWVKNRRLESGTTSIVIPSGTTAQQPAAPVVGQFRFNTSTALMEFFNGSAFVPLAAAGGVSYAVDQFTGDDSTTVFTMSQAESITTQIIVFVGSIYQDPYTAYTLDGSTDITFTSAPPSGEPISVIHTIS